jgi:hypothetical protein
LLVRAVNGVGEADPDERREVVMSKIQTGRKRLVAGLVALLLGLGVLGLSAPAGADIDDLTTCVDVDENGQPQCETPDDGVDDFVNPTEDPDGGGGELPPAPVDDPVVADATFTG